MARMFGTDGVRGVANGPVLNVELAYKLGRAAALYFGREVKTPKILIGRDTRLSGTMLESALAAGICSAGGNAHLLGVIPTPAVSFLTEKLEANAGVVISASHNPFEDNGIKFFARTGYKLPDAVEDEIEAIVNQPVDYANTVTGSNLGRVIQEPDMGMVYVKHIVDSADVKLNGLKVVMDCANGANSEIAPAILRTLGAHVIPIFHEPNGININNGCGSTHLEALQAKVKEVGADCGLANDGDADRLLAVDENGDVLDGDQIMLICALDLMKAGKLKDNVLVTTVMSNVGLAKAMKEHGGSTVKTAVGDRYVLEEMLKYDYKLGGEQSGHIIFGDLVRTGDGMMTGVKLLGSLVRHNQTLSQLGALMVKYPQTLLNVRVKDKNGWQENQAIADVVRKYTEELGDDGQVLVRASGTEPLIRIMAQGPNQVELDNITEAIAEVVRKELA
ncbi:phosphoglucosamine mutase [Acidaminococcus fermentans]|uniref:phosphoglucosamine mutase n=1 Tax=Acidaminococcus fermentans TaxID=905 RepID=UPI002E792353|nr:phosphoglucosamine mutase [Acidaminococcus fermentans]MEE1597296.1 phosphoglucosamine mutase [Acidaminococcus fermentans]MEE4121561.1 phosphoglucosamine mutase [Acidaminococcus fermentans]